MTVLRIPAGHLGKRCSEAGIRSGEGESLAVGRDLCWEAKSPTVFTNNTASQKEALEAGEAGGLRAALAQERRAGSHRSFSGARGWVHHSKKLETG